MKTAFVVAVVLAAVAFSSAEDDGQYRPELYGGDDGRYRPFNDGRYFHYYNSPSVTSYLGRSGRVNPLVTYNPYFYSFQPYQQILAPVVSYNGDPASFDQETFASSVKAVTAKPPAATIATALPALRAAATTPKPLINFGLPVYARQYYHTAEANANIVRQINDANSDSYHYLYQTDSGINAEESGQVRSNAGTRASGFFEYVGDDGRTYRVDYTADENGFRPVGAHLP